VSITVADLLEPAEIPSIEEVRAWLRVSPADFDDLQLERVYYGELGLQAKFNDVDPYTDELALAFMRRCARTAAARGAPLGTLPLQMTGYPDQYGALVIPRLDAEIERFEAPTRIIAIA
jgi:hypothetical protein